MQSEMQTIKALKTHPNIVSFFELNEVEVLNDLNYQATPCFINLLFFMLEKSEISHYCNGALQWRESL